MCHRKQNKWSFKQIFSTKNRTLLPVGFFLVIAGIFLAWEKASLSEIPYWVDRGPVIEISSEIPMANFNVRCNVKDEGIFSLALGAGDSLDEPCRIWVFVYDFSFPFRWEIRSGEVENLLLYSEFANDSANNDEITSESDYFLERIFLSQATGLREGESIEWCNGIIYEECFTAVINPGEQTSVEIKFQMDSQHAVWKDNGDIIVRMPVIMEDRGMAVYDTTIGEFKENIDNGKYNLLPYLSSKLIDEVPLFEPALKIIGRYASEYIYNPNYILNKTTLEPEELLPCFYWTAGIQWVPFLSFHDLRFDRIQFIRTWFSGLLTAVGSGMVTIPLSDWLQFTHENQK